MNLPGRYHLPLIILFLLFTLPVFFFPVFFEKRSIDAEVLLGANALFLLIGVISFYIQRRGLAHKNPHVFVRSVMSAMMFKMIICIAAVLTYVLASGKTFNKRAVFISLFIYLIYLATEVFVVMKMNKKRKVNA